MTPERITSAFAIDRQSRGPALRAFRWMFLSRRSGHITIAQWPNISLWVVIVLSIAGRVSTSGTAAALVRGFARAALLIWALDEVVRGVNPFRRILGLVVVVVVAGSLAS